MILGDAQIVRTIFFHLRGPQATYAWGLRSGLDRTWSRKAILAAMGAPKRSGTPGPEGCIGHDRFKLGHLLLHFEYEANGQGVRRITAMSPATAPATAPG